MYRPTDSDSDDDYDGFYFGGDNIKKTRQQHFVKDPEDEICDALIDGNLDVFQQRINAIEYDINSITKNGLTLLHNACTNGQLDIITYLLENKANPNRQIDSVTPLIQACNNNHIAGTLAMQIVQKLLEYDVVVNVSDRYGMTPLLLACKNGYLEVAKLLLIMKASLEACDNQGWTSIFHAIENNHMEIIKMLIENRINLNKTDIRGYTPLQIAQFHGFNEIMEILPQPEVKYQLPSTYYAYNKLLDIIPRIFQTSEVPEYFQEITSILGDIDMDRFVQHFALAGCSLGEFLTMTDESMEKIGIQYSVHRQKIKIELLNFHLHHWSKKSIAKVKRVEKDSFYEILMIAANHLQNLIIVASSLKYIQNNIDRAIMGKVNVSGVSEMRNHLDKYKKSLNGVINVVKYLRTFSPPKSIIHVDYEELLAERKQTNIRRCVKYTILFGFSIAFILKVKKVI